MFGEKVSIYEKLLSKNRSFLSCNLLGFRIQRGERKINEWRFYSDG